MCDVYIKPILDTDFCFSERTFKNVSYRIIWLLNEINNKKQIKTNTSALLENINSIYHIYFY